MGDRVTSKWMLVERVRYIVKDFGEKNKDFGEKIKLLEKKWRFRRKNKDFGEKIRILEKKKDFKEKIKMK